MDIAHTLIFALCLSPFVGVLVWLVWLGFYVDHTSFGLFTGIV